MPAPDRADDAALAEVAAKALAAGDAPSAEAVCRALVGQLPALVYVDPVEEDADSLYVSPYVETLLGVSPQEWLADPYCWSRHVHPDDLDRTWDDYEQTLAKGLPLEREYRMIHADGSVRWVAERASVIHDGSGAPSLIQGLIFDVTEQKSAQEMSFLAYHDRLTGLPNGALFEEMLGLSLARARRTGTTVAVMFLDLDDFKQINDAFGHASGDLLLATVAARLRPCVRESDLIARRSGDEFLVLLGELDANRDHAVVACEMVAGRVHEVLREPIEIEGLNSRVSASIGVSLFPHDAPDLSTLLKHADTAMYRSKRAGSGGWHLYTGEEPAQADAAVSIAGRIRRAVHDEAWVLHWQPIVDLTTGRPVAAEALIRWRDLNGGLVAPGDFLPIAEEMGLIEAIGDWVIEEVCRHEGAWRELAPDLKLTVNLAPRQLWSARLSDKLLTRLRAAGVDPHRLVLEVGEGTAMADPERAQKVLYELRAWGLGLAIDDFGTAQASLARLKTLPADFLKIDRAFVRGVDVDPYQQGVVRAVVALTQTLAIEAVAVGVETEAEAAFLRGAGCRLAQGFLFGRPMPSEDFEASLRSLAGSARAEVGIADGVGAAEIT